MFGLGESVSIGYDLSTEYAQISYMSNSMDSPKTLSAKDNSEQLNIPIVLFKRQGVNQWLYGCDAEGKSGSNEGILIGSLWERALVGDMVTVDEEEFDPVSLLLLFIKRSLNLVLLEVKRESISGIMFTVPALTRRAIEVLETVMSQLELGKTKVFFQGREESIYYYMINQPAELWTYDVSIYDYGTEGLKCYTFQENRNSTPRVAFVDCKEYPGFGKAEYKRDDEFLQVIDETIGNKLVSCVFLIGKGFVGDWYNKSLKVLCRKRRAFMGNNLYSRGACYACMDRISAKSSDNPVRVFLGAEKLRSNIGMYVNKGAERAYLPLLDAGINWYDGKMSVDMYLWDGNSFEIVVTPLDGRNVRVVEIVLDGLTMREPGTTRIRLEAIMESPVLLRINATDLGFGDFYPASNQLFTKEIKLNE